MLHSGFSERWLTAKATRKRSPEGTQLSFSTLLYYELRSLTPNSLLWAQLLRAHLGTLKAEKNYEKASIFSVA